MIKKRTFVLGLPILLNGLFSLAGFALPPHHPPRKSRLSPINTIEFPIKLSPINTIEFPINKPHPFP